MTTWYKYDGDDSLRVAILKTVTGQGGGPLHVEPVTDDDIVARAKEIIHKRETPPEWFGELQKLLYTALFRNRHDVMCSVTFHSDGSGHIETWDEKQRTSFGSLREFWMHIQPFT